MLLTPKEHTYFKDQHACLSFSYKLAPQTCPWAFVLSLEISLKTVKASWLSHSMTCYQLIYNNNNLNLTLPTKSSTTTLFIGCCWLQDPSSVTKTWVLSSGMLPSLWYSIRKVYNLPAPEYQPIHLGNTRTEAPSLLAHWLQCSFPFLSQMEHWSNHNHSSMLQQLFPNFLSTFHQSSLLFSTGSSSTPKKGTCSPSEGLCWPVSSVYTLILT